MTTINLKNKYSNACPYIQTQKVLMPIQELTHLVKKIGVGRKAQRAMAFVDPKAIAVEAYSKKSACLDDLLWNMLSYTHVPTGMPVHILDSLYSDTMVDKIYPHTFKVDVAILEASRFNYMMLYNTAHTLYQKLNRFTPKGEEPIVKVVCEAKFLNSAYKYQTYANLENLKFRFFSSKDYYCLGWIGFGRGLIEDHTVYSKNEKNA